MTAAAPVPDISSAPFWAAAAEGRLLLQRCGLDGALQWYPRVHCVVDWNATPEWVESPGFGTVYSYTIAPGTGGNPSTIFALVRLDEGPMLSTELVEVAPADMRIGMAVAVCFAPSVDGIAIPRFRPRTTTA